MCKNRYEAAATPQVTREQLADYLVRHYGVSKDRALRCLDKSRYGEGKRKPTLHGIGTVKVIATGEDAFMIVPACLPSNGYRVCHYRDMRLDAFYRELLSLDGEEVANTQQSGLSRHRLPCRKMAQCMAH